jgi:hypothetical protein
VSVPGRGWAGKGAELKLPDYSHCWYQNLPPPVAAKISTGEFSKHHEESLMLTQKLLINKNWQVGATNEQRFKYRYLAEAICLYIFKLIQQMS